MKRGTLIVFVLIATVVLIQIVQETQATMSPAMFWPRLTGGAMALVLTLLVVRERVPR